MKAADMVKKVQELDKIVHKTKCVSALLLKEQEERGAGAERMERELVQAHADLARSNATKQKMEQEQRKLNQRIRRMKDRINELQDDLENEQSGKIAMKRKFMELEATIEIQQVRSNKLQDELNSSQALLVDSTSATAESRLALDNCQQASDRMAEANQHLHRQLLEHQVFLHKQKVLHQEELARAHKDRQDKQLVLDTQNELFEKLRMEKLTVEKRQESQAAKISSLERRLKLSTNLMEKTVTFPSTPQNSNTISSLLKTNAGASTSNVSGRDENNHHPSPGVGIDFTIPRLGGEKRNLAIISTGKKCSICFKDSGGLMKKCECSRRDCKIRAHASCVQHFLMGSASSCKSNPVCMPVILCCPSSNKTSSSSTSEGFNMHHSITISPR
ncbi:unnamed protein product [Pseudo-nitzschia multistriata]|uniref:Uncharacterized protein n=1 Tax=Pseudo-nitzschia multistriata TaxID=183589 RepID=A0A448Z809_9STRA|nr:unnamed protein product [Pseudo-nitzschia multistriata]